MATENDRFFALLVPIIPAFIVLLGIIGGFIAIAVTSP